MRHLMQRRKARLEHQHAEERADREAEERKHKLKKAKKREPDEDRPLAVGAHGVARQDGTDGKGRDSPYTLRTLEVLLNCTHVGSFLPHYSAPSASYFSWNLLSSLQLLPPAFLFFVGSLELCLWTRIPKSKLQDRLLRTRPPMMIPMRIARPYLQMKKTAICTDIGQKSGEDVGTALAIPFPFFA
ncbi:hypothetical protein MPH_04361 [Macrophomina phaseolina MS6]|uniref:Uncharacterized protein n=1 Tax=Macrophomina phaseolina (strain MS6) TaxID=1126212 RepID=K2SNH8_MACPH|nr:hypothetical protein MPH_04361 [Macrophomina phaseolina MS6]